MRPKLSIAGGICALAAPLILPMVEAAEGVIQGTLVPSKDGKAVLAQVKKVLLLDRDLPQELVQKTVHVKETAAVFDPKSGSFEAKGLDPKKSYDLYVECSDGRVFEGVDLTPKKEAEGALPPEGKKDIEKHFYGMQQFTNENRILCIQGNPKSAAALVELCRTIEFHASGKGEVIWRIERWDYASGFGAWQPDGTKVLRRFRLEGDAWKKLSWVFPTDWGGLKPGGEARTFVLPDEAAVAGRCPGMKIEKHELEAVAPGEKKKPQHVEDLGAEKDPALVPKDE
ncbi:MAG: hypothetical protein HY291_06460 [Planctomycetes bacterium]|nr:hypothetical protein [Planctomycetota bacterium]